MDLTRKTGRELTALHHGYNMDILADADKIMALAALADTLPPGNARHSTLAQAADLLAETKITQAMAQEVFTEIERRAGMTSPAGNESEPRA